MRKNIVAGNWKMNKTLQEGIALAKELNEALANEKPNCDVIICTPFIHLASVTPSINLSIITAISNRLLFFLFFTNLRNDVLHFTLLLLSFRSLKSLTVM